MYNIYIALWTFSPRTPWCPAPRSLKDAKVDIVYGFIKISIFSGLSLPKFKFHFQIKFHLMIKIKILIEQLLHILEIWNIL